MTTFAIGGELIVSRMGLGSTGTVGPGFLGPPADPQAVKALLREAVERGVDLIDTADAYGPFISEELIADALHPYRDHVVVATKGGSLRPAGPDVWAHDGRPDHLRGACEASLRRLRLDVLPLYQFHWPDDDVPFADSVGALRELRDEGKVRHVGVCNVTLDQLEEACAIVEIATVQNAYSPGDRRSEEIVDACERRGIAFLAYSPLGEGRLERLGAGVDAIARETGATRGQVALAWLLQRSPVVIPIPGTGSARHLAENLQATGLQLTAEQLRRLDRPQ